MSFNVKIITPQGTAFEGEATHVRLPGEDGYFGVLSHHAPFITSSPGGHLLIRDKSGQETQFEIGQGFFEVTHDEGVFLVQSFEKK